jgi:hypothetical protein
LRAGDLVDEMAVDIEEARCHRAAGQPDDRPRSCRRGSSDSWLKLEFEDRRGRLLERLSRPMSHHLKQAASGKEPGPAEPSIVVDRREERSWNARSARSRRCTN